MRAARARFGLCLGMGLAALPSVASAADWVLQDPTVVDGIDGLTTDQPVLEVQVTGDEDERIDIRLERVDPWSGLMLKAAYDEVSCTAPWRHAVTADGMKDGDSVLWFLTSRMPPAPYMIVDRPSGSNGAWKARGEPMWIITQPVARVVPCHDVGGRISIARQPVVVAARDRARRAVVRVTVGDARGQGVLINPWGHVLTAASLVGDAAEVEVGLSPAGHGPLVDRVLTYVPLASMMPADAGSVAVPGSADGGDAAHDLVVLVPVQAPGLPRFFDSFAPLVDRGRDAGVGALSFRHAAWMYTTERGTNRMVPVAPSTPQGTLVMPMGEPQGPLLELADTVDASQVGGPVFDHVGRVWGILTDTQTAQWTTHIVQRYLEWTSAGFTPALRGPAKPESTR